MKNINNNARQKMMSLMYLVLIVLLGLQVSNSHLENLETLNEILEERTQIIINDNLELLHDTKELVKLQK